MADDTLPAPATDATPLPDTTGIQTVLVDDHPIVLEGLARALQRDGLDVVATFLGGGAALDHLAAHPVDLMVVDLRLGGRSGIEVIERAHRLRPVTRLAVLTSFEDRAAATAAVRAGATGFLLKDALSGQLSTQLRSVAEGNLVIDSRVVDAVLHPPSAVLVGHEEQILRLVAEGLTNRQVGERLHLSPHTVKEYLARVMHKLGATSRTATVIRAVELGLLDSRARGGSGHE